MRIFIIAAFLLTVPVSAIGQIVNVLPMTRDLEDGWHGTLGGRLDWRSGNTDLLQIGAEAQIAVRRGVHLGLAVVDAEVGLESGDSFVAQGFAHFRYRRRLSARVAIEGFNQVGYSRFRRLDYRVLAGVGPRFRLWKGERSSGHWGSVYMLELERLREGDELDAGERSTNHRTSSYLTMQAELNKSIEASLTAFAQPNMGDFSDFRFLGEGQIYFKFTENLGLLQSAILRWDSEPPDGVEGLDTGVHTAFALSF